MSETWLDILRGLLYPMEQVLDEADRLLNEDFEKSIDEILNVIPRDRRTYLFSATMTKKVYVQLFQRIYIFFFFVFVLLFSSRTMVWCILNTIKWHADWTCVAWFLFF